VWSGSALAVGSAWASLLSASLGMQSGRLAATLAWLAATLTSLPRHSSLPSRCSQILPTARIVGPGRREQRRQLSGLETRSYRSSSLRSRRLRSLSPGWAALISLSLGCGSSSGPKPKPPQPVVIPNEPRPCLVDAPPVVETYIKLDTAEEGCPSPWLFCLSSESASELGSYLQRLRRWADMAWARCGNESEAGDITYAGDPEGPGGS